MSHGEILKMPPSEVPQHRNLQPQVPNVAGVRSPAASSSSLPPHSPVSSNSSSTSVNEYKVARYWDQWRRINGEGLIALVLNIIRIMETFFLNQWSLWTGPPILGGDNMLKHTSIIVSFITRMWSATSLTSSRRVWWWGPSPPPATPRDEEQEEAGMHPAATGRKETSKCCDYVREWVVTFKTLTQWTLNKTKMLEKFIREKHTTEKGIAYIW